MFSNLDRGSIAGSIRLGALTVALALTAACDEASAPLPDDLQAVPVVSGLASPVAFATPAGDSRLFIVEQRGTIRVVKNGQLLTAPYLDIRAKLTSGGERGLLGLAFHPNFAQNGFFYVQYTDLNGNSEIERYHALPASDVADANSATHILGFNQPFANHNGGNLLFGPDGKLWIGTGDGGSGGDPQGNGQRLTTLLGKMLRIDVDAASPYGIPTDNPFATSTVNRQEIWGWGLRNPWRYSIDRVTGLLYVADVGQNQWEEVHVVPTTMASVNYGWVIMEGMHCYNATTCNQTGLNIPVLEYGHGDGCAITGGFVYRGAMIPGIVGHYFYSDACSGFLRSFRYESGTANDLREWDVGDIGGILSFGEDSAGELYALSSNGTVYRIAPAGN